MADRLALPLAAPHAVLACGAYLKNRAGRLDGAQFTWSAAHGDLGDVDACRALDASVDALLDGPRPAAIAHDLHPDFASTRLAQDVAARLGVPAIPVQHHHAHIAAVIAEHGLSAPVIGLALDGVGLGSDGGVWGGEVLWVDGGHAVHRWARVAHLPPLPLPGGDVAAREPWRLAAAVLHVVGRGDEIEAHLGPQAGTDAARIVRTLLQRGLHCPPTTSAGRWFDAAAGALGLSVRQRAEAEAAIALEALAAGALDADRGRLEADLPRLTDANGADGLLALPALVASFFDIGPQDGAASADAALRFHFALADGLCAAAATAARHRGVRDVVFGGGCFLNRVLGARLRAGLEAAGLVVHAPRAVPCGDAGLALGQAWVAACMLADPATRPAPLLEPALEAC